MLYDCTSYLLYRSRRLANVSVNGKKLRRKLKMGRSEAMAGERTDQTLEWWRREDCWVDTFFFSFSYIPVLIRYTGTAGTTNKYRDIPPSGGDISQEYCSSIRSSKRRSEGTVSLRVTVLPSVIECLHDELDGVNDLMSPVQPQQSLMMIKHEEWQRLN